MDTIVVPVDGASNIKLEVLDFDTLTVVSSSSAPTPVCKAEGLEYNCTSAEFSWFDSAIKQLPEPLKEVRVIAPAARGASGGLVGPDNTLIEVPGQGLTLAYTQDYPDEVEKSFRELAGEEGEFFAETGSVRDFPGSLTLLKRFVFEEMERPRLLGGAGCFASYGALISGHFVGDDYLRAVRDAGNEHSYWMCHTGARNINGPPGTPSSVSKKIKSFGRLVPPKASPVYEPLGRMPRNQAVSLGLGRACLVIPGGHDTCLSHLPVMSTFYQAFPDRAGTPVVHLEAGTWTLVSLVGGKAVLPADGYRRDILVQGTVDGQPVVTARYGGGNDFKHVAGLAAMRGGHFEGKLDQRLLASVLAGADCFLLPNISPANCGTGPFPSLKGKIINRSGFFQTPEKAFVLANLCTAMVTVSRIEALKIRKHVPVVLTAGGARDPYFGRLVATLTDGEVYALFDRSGRPITETTALGAAIAGKAACLQTHPYRVDVSGLGVEYRKLEPFDAALARALAQYRDLFLRELEKVQHRK